MSYQVFARKYRPQTFDDVVGQEHITRTLKNAIAQNRLAHAYLFVGPRGTGKTSTARILAKCLCCVKAPTVEPCGVCDACKEIAAGISLDVLEIDGASNNGVDQVRDLRDNVRYAPTHGAYKIYVIDEVHMLTTAAFNALLKTLEEPPEHVKFIFATTEPQKVLPTILSRCQRFDLRRIPAVLIAAHLQKISGLEKINLADDAAEAIARGAEGGLRDAESMLDQLVAFCGDAIALDDVLGIFGFTAPETVAQLADGLLRGQTSDALSVLDAQSESGKDLLRLMGELIGHLRNLLVYRVNTAAVEADAGQTMLGAYQAQAELVSTERLLELIDQFAAAEGRMKWAPNKKLHFEIALIKAIQTLGQATLTDVIDTLTALREGSGGDSASSAAAALAGPRPGAPPSYSSSSATASAASPAPMASAGSMDWKSLKQAVAKPKAEAASSTPASRTPAAKFAAETAPAASGANISAPATASTTVAPATAALAATASAAAPTLTPSPAPADTAPQAAAPTPISAAARAEQVREESAPAAKLTSAAPAAKPARTVPAAKPAPDEDEPEATPSPAAVSDAPINGHQVWRRLIQEIQSQRPLITAWVREGRVLSVDKNVVRIGYDTHQKMVVESLNKANNRKFLETLLTKLAGRDVTLKLELTDEPAMEEFSSSSSAANEDEPDFASEVNAPARPATRQASASANADGTPEDPYETFKKDPQIQKALQLFEGEIRSVNKSPA